MRFFLSLMPLMGALLSPSVLAQAPTTPQGAIVQARSDYSDSLGRLTEGLSTNCVSSLVNVVNCNRTFVS